jgi:inorganic pyrophosphatase
LAGDTQSGREWVTDHENRTPATEYLGSTVVVTVDRPLGSQHPDYGFRYQLNYGYLAGTLAPDGEELDAYILGVQHPVSQFSGLCIAVIHRTDDCEDKLVVASPGQEFTDAQILRLTAFQERFFSSVILRKAPDSGL